MTDYKMKLSDRCTAKHRRLKKKFAKERAAQRGPVSKAARMETRRSATWTRDCQDKTRKTP